MIEPLILEAIILSVIDGSFRSTRKTMMKNPLTIVLKISYHVLF